MSNRAYRGELQELRTVEPTLWHENDSGHFTVPAGSAVREVQDLEAEVSDPVERAALLRLVKREAEAGKAPVLVWLAGRVRCVDRRDLVQVLAGKGRAA